MSPRRLSYFAEGMALLPAWAKRPGPSGVDVHDSPLDFIFLCSLPAGLDRVMYRRIISMI